MRLLTSTNFSLVQQIRRSCHDPHPHPPRHLICFKQWTAEMVMNIINSAISLKCCCRDTHGRTLDTLTGHKVMILQEVNEPILNMAVSKAATFLGAQAVNITDKLVWEHDYNGKVFSLLSDIIFVCTATHMCVQRFANMSTVPVMCMKSRTHASIQALSTIMSIIEYCGTMTGVNMAYLGPAHPVLNSYLLLCPMLGANIQFKCCCDICPVTPLLFNVCEEMCTQAGTKATPCKTKEEVLKNATVLIAGPTTKKKEKLVHFKFTEKDIAKYSCYCNWLFYHTCPRGEEVPDDLFNHINAKTYYAFENMLYISAALMAYGIKGHKF